MSFIDQDDIISVWAKTSWPRCGARFCPTRSRCPIARMTYADAMSHYGSDKPDLRFGNELVDCTAFFKATPFRVFQTPYVGAVVMPGGASQTRKELDGWTDWAKSRGARRPRVRARQRGRRAGWAGREESLRR